MKKCASLWSFAAESWNMKKGVPPRAAITAASSPRVGCVYPDMSDQGVATSVPLAKNPYDIGTEATLAALRQSGVLTRTGKLGKIFR